MQGDFTQLHAVVLNVPDYFVHFSGRDRTSKLSLLAREALAYSLELSGISEMVFQKDPNGAPIPVNGVYWSLSHTTEFVAAIAAPRPVGIDIEEIGAFADNLHQQIANEEEWGLVKTVSSLAFYSFWTAKEAVLKAEGVGLKGLADCQIIAVDGMDKMLLKYKSRTWRVVNHLINDNYMVALTNIGIPIVWHQLSR